MRVIALVPAFLVLFPGLRHGGQFQRGQGGERAHVAGGNLIRVRLSLPNGAKLYNHATTSVGYASSSEAVVRFGLGPWEFASEVQIQWPNGKRQVLADIKADQLLDPSH